LLGVREAGEFVVVKGSKECDDNGNIDKNTLRNLLWVSDNATILHVLFTALRSSAIHVHLAYMLVTYLRYSFLTVSEVVILTTFLCPLCSKLPIEFVRPANGREFS
jgi:hypothetical protein